MRARALIAVLLTLVLSATTPAALAGPPVSLHVALTPEDLGRGTTITFSFRVATPAGSLPSPLVGLDLSYPYNIGLATSGLGLEACTSATLELSGSEGCPSEALMGRGSATVEIPFGPTIVKEPGRITTWMAPTQNGRLALLFFAEGKAPVLAQLIFSGLVQPAPVPFGGRLNTRIPLIPSLPENPNGAVVQMTATIGPMGILYHHEIHGRSVAYRPAGVHLPDSCPRGGFPFSATFTFLDGSDTVTATKVPCPRRR